MSVKNFIRRLNFRLIGSIGLALVFVVTVTLVISMMVKVAKGVSYTVETPERVLRLEILNGCQKAGIASAAAKKLSAYKDGYLEIIVVGTGDFETRKLSGTIVISREKDKTAAQHLARIVGIDEAEVVYRPLENNYRQVSATLVVGEDYDVTALPAVSDKE